MWIPLRYSPHFHNPYYYGEYSFWKVLDMLFLVSEDHNNHKKIGATFGVNPLKMEAEGTTHERGE